MGGVSFQIFDAMKAENERLRGRKEGQMVIDKIELLALKKLALICGALADQLQPSLAREQRALTRVLCDVIDRAEIDNARAEAVRQEV